MAVVALRSGGHARPGPRPAEFAARGAWFERSKRYPLGDRPARHVADGREQVPLLAQRRELKPASDAPNRKLGP